MRSARASSAASGSAVRPRAATTIAAASSDRFVALGIPPAQRLVGEQLRRRGRRRRTTAGLIRAAMRPASSVIVRRAADGHRHRQRAAGGACLGGQGRPDRGRIGDRSAPASAGRRHRGRVADDAGEALHEGLPHLGEVGVGGVRPAHYRVEVVPGQGDRRPPQPTTGRARAWSRCGTGGPTRTGPRRKAWFSQVGELASWTAPAGRAVIASKCHWMTSGVIGIGPNSGSVAAAARLAMSCAPNSWPSGLGSTRPPCATASSWRAEADAEGRDLVRDRLPQQRPDSGQPREAPVVGRAHRAAEHHQPRVAAEVVRHLRPGDRCAPRRRPLRATRPAARPGRLSSFWTTSTRGSLTPRL